MILSNLLFPDFQQQSKEVLSLPDVLAINCQLENPRDLEFWKVQLMVSRRLLLWSSQLCFVFSHRPMPKQNVHLYLKS